MKIVHPKLNSRLELSNEKINTLIIENPLFMYELLWDIKGQIDNREGYTVLSHNDEPVSFAKYAELITDPLSVDLNQKNIIKKMLNAMEKCGLNDVYYEQTQKLLAGIENLIQELSLNFDADIECHELSLQQLLKAADISIADNYRRLADRLYAYMELVREFDGDKLFLFVNLSSYIDEQQMQEFADTVIGHSFRVLLIDSHDFPRLGNENRLTVDRDLCEF